MSKKQITIALVDDHTLFRSGVAKLMSEFEEISLLFEAANGLELQSAVKKYGTPDVVLMDISMPQMDGYEATAWLKKNYPNICTLALSMFEEEEAIIRMLKAGASGYILKESKPVELLHAIKTVIEKGYFINELVSGRLVASLQKAEDTTQAQNITQKEFDFLQYCSTELTYKEIADRLNISPRTVDNYRESLFAKLNIKSRTGLVVYGIKKGWIKIS